MIDLSKLSAIIGKSLDGRFARGSREIEAGGGLVGGGDLSADRAISLGTPSTLSKDSTNSVDAETHSHELSDNLKAWDNLDPSSLPPSVAYRRANILGTVSQAGGAPTGAIIERGSNANGEYIRFADGTQICWAEVSFDTSHAQTYDYRLSYSWTFPANFKSAADRVLNISLPMYNSDCFLGISGAATGRASVRSYGGGITGSGSAASFAIFFDSGSVDTGNAVVTNVQLWAIGRWF